MRSIVKGILYFDPLTETDSVAPMESKYISTVFMLTHFEVTRTTQHGMHLIDLGLHHSCFRLGAKGSIVCECAMQATLLMSFFVGEPKIPKKE